MESLSNEGYGHAIRGRFFKNPKITDSQLHRYQIRRDEYWTKFLSNKGNFGGSVKALEIADALHTALYPS